MAEKVKKAKVRLAKKLGVKQVIGLLAITLLILNLLLFSFRKISSMVFWIALIVVWGLAYLLVKIIKE